MRTEKRKARLDKGDSGDFIGFAAYATSSARAPTSDPSTTSSTLRWSPIYTGNDSQLALLLTKIGQKRDGATKAKALQDLQHYLTNNDTLKKNVVDALAHVVFLFHSKLVYDSMASVRAEVLTCMGLAAKRVPKAWKTLTSQQPEILGMIYCAQADPAMEVRTSAERVVRDSVSSSDSNNNSMEYQCQGVWDYVLRILSYGRPKAMHDTLFAKKNESGDLSEAEKDRLEERFERIVGTVLSGLELWIQTQVATAAAPLPTHQSQLSVLWKTLSCPKASLRRRTYSLLATCCRNLPHLVYGGSCSFSQQLLPQLFTSEKDAANFPSLFEMCLLYLAGAMKHDQASTNPIMEPLVKHMSKVLKKSCYGATANKWGPTLLPLLSSIPSEEHRLLLLSSTWSGLEHLVGTSDKLSILTTVTECATFLLLQPATSTEDPPTPTYPREIANLWVKALSEYLRGDNSMTSSVSQGAESILLNSLSRDIQKLDVACRAKDHKVVHVVSDWFWTDGIQPVMLAAATSIGGCMPLTRLLNTVSQQPNMTTNGLDVNWQSVLLSLFSNVVSQYQVSSAAVPSLEAYALTEAILRGCNMYGCSPFADNNEDRSKFVMNDILRWLVIHTSTVSLQRHERHAERCFHLLRICLLPLSMDEQQSLLESCLRELITAKCDTELLAHGITILLKDIPAEALMCASLDEYLIQLGRELTENSGNTNNGQLESEGEEDEGSRQKALTLLETVAAVGVGKGVLQGWIESACANRNIKESLLKEPVVNPLLETLVIVSRSGGSLAREDATNVMLECWRRGQELWSGQCFRLLIEDEALCRIVIARASLELKASLDDFCAGGRSCIGYDVFAATSLWSERAVRLLDLCADVRSTHGNLPVPSLKVIGLGDKEVWERSYNERDATALLVSFFCLMNTLVSFEDVNERCQIVRDSSDKPHQVAVHVLFALSTNEKWTDSALNKQYSRCGQFLSILGGSTLGATILECWFRDVVDRLVVKLRAGSAINIVSGGIAVISLLVDLMLETSQPASEDASDKLKDSTIHVGDEVWYLTSVDDKVTREKATVVLVHSDDFPNLYYTLSVDSGSNKVERQTVADRIRRSNFPHDRPLPEEIEKLKNRVRETISRELLKPFLKIDLPVESVAELINVLNFQIGWDKRVGLGSIHFEILSQLRSMEQRLVSLLASPAENQREIVSLLNSLSVALGFGSSTPSFPRSFDHLRLNPEASILAIHRYYSEVERLENNDINRAALRWLTVSIARDSIAELRKSVGGLIFTIASQLIDMDDGQSGFSDDCFLALKSIVSAMHSVVAIDNGLSGLAETEIKCMQSLFSKFASGWKDSTFIDVLFSQFGLQRGGNLPRWHPSLSSLVSVLADNNDGLRIVGRGCCNDLVGALFDPPKQGIAMRMLDAVFACAEALYDESEFTAGPKLQRKLQTWKNALVDEEVDDLEEDIGIINSWVPSQLAEEVISWTEEMEAAEDEVLAVGRMLCWLCLLRLTESAASKDVRNRLAFSSFFDKCAAVTALLNLALRHFSFRIDRKAKVNDVIRLEDMVQNQQPYEVSRLAELVLFRTVEVLPTMSKRWFEEECPKQSTQSISDFVTTHVAPETFRRELVRIKSASVFGDMAVTGSLATRQVTATYAQDDFNLRVVVELPPCFPFRSAEVDCSKTLGIPEKRWRQWGLQIRLMLNSQDGTLQDALMLWKENVDKEFTGVEPCPVCYSVLSVKKHELPNIECKTCHNRFHSTCLKQWFLSSGKSQCVLCQQPWSGIRTQ